jgi:hypothetical protein
VFTFPFGWAGSVSGPPSWALSPAIAAPLAPKNWLTCTTGVSWSTQQRDDDLARGASLWLHSPSPFLFYQTSNSNISLKIRKKQQLIARPHHRDNLVPPNPSPSTAASIAIHCHSHRPGPPISPPTLFQQSGTNIVHKFYISLL